MTDPADGDDGDIEDGGDRGFGVERVQDIFERGMLEGESPEFPVAFERLRAEASERMSWQAEAYVHGGAGTEDTFERNKDFSRWRIVPRMLRGVADRDLSTTVLGETHDYPLMVAPIGVQGMLHGEGEVATARACAELNVPFTLSTVASRSMEDVAAVLGDTPKWFQYYWSSDPDIAASLLGRAEAAGYDAVVVTVDVPTLGWRERLIEKGYYPFLDGEGMGNYRSDPAFRERLDEPPEEDPEAAVEAFTETFGDPSLAWEDLAFVRERTDLPLVVKGILHPDDARKAIEAGADGVQVSTHGGRQVDGAVSAVEALPEIAEAVGDDATLVFDSGVRRGEHVFKTLALGADTVMLGRPFAYGLAHSGVSGVENVLANTLAQLDLTMGQCGIGDVDDIDRGAVRDERTL